jgi:hypothetical protein
MYSKKGWPGPGAFLVIPTLLVLLAVLTGACRNDEGQGGTASISGTIIEHFYNDDYSKLIYKKPALDEEVFISYGDDNVMGDRALTGLTGEFRFKYLFPGRYYIYFRSKDSTATIDEEREKIFLVNLERGEDRDLGSIEKLNTLEFNEGGAVIKGRVKVINYVDESRWPNLVVEDVAMAHEHEIYLTYGNHTFYDERVRTQSDGGFEFRNLIPGDYFIFLYSEDVTRVTEHVVIEFEVSIEEIEQVIDLGEITIEEL